MGIKNRQTLLKNKIQNKFFLRYSSLKQRIWNSIKCWCQAFNAWMTLISWLLSLEQVRFIHWICTQDFPIQGKPQKKYQGWQPPQICIYVLISIFLRKTSCKYKPSNLAAKWSWKWALFSCGQEPLESSWSMKVFKRLWL